jgi:hypothetical protein
VISDEIVQRTLSFMRQPADARVTDGIACEICERTASVDVLETFDRFFGNQVVRSTGARI